MARFNHAAAPIATRPASRGTDDGTWGRSRNAQPDAPVRQGRHRQRVPALGRAEARLPRLRGIRDRRGPRLADPGRLWGTGGQRPPGGCEPLATGHLRDRLGPDDHRRPPGPTRRGRRAVSSARRPTRAEPAMSMTGVKRHLRDQRIELPSWAFGNSGTRFKVFAQSGVPRDPYEKVADAAQVHAFTGVAPSVALHIPWDRVDD